MGKEFQQFGEAIISSMESNIRCMKAVKNYPGKIISKVFVNLSEQIFFDNLQIGKNHPRKILVKTSHNKLGFSPGDGITKFKNIVGCLKKSSIPPKPSRRALEDFGE